MRISAPQVKSLPVPAEAVRVRREIHEHADLVADVEDVAVDVAPRVAGVAAREVEGALLYRAARLCGVLRPGTLVLFREGRAGRYW